MKVLVVLVFAVFTGCNADFFHADAPKPQLEVLTDTFWDYASKATTTAERTMHTLRGSQFGHDISRHLSDGAMTAHKYALRVQEQLPPAALDIISTVATETDLLRQRIIGELSHVKDALEPITEKMKVVIQERGEQLKLELTTLVESVDAAAVRTTLKDLRLNLDLIARELDAQLEPLKETVGKHMLVIKDKVAPMTEAVQRGLIKKVQEVRDLAYPYVNQLRGKVDSLNQEA